jgi:aminocyclitol acetyltransferase
MFSFKRVSNLTRRKKVKAIKEKTDNRELVLWGTDDSAISCVEVLASHGLDISFCVSKESESRPYFYRYNVYGNDAPDKTRHYVIVANHDPEAKDELSGLGFEQNRDYVCFADYSAVRDMRMGGIKRRDMSREYTQSATVINGVRVGKYTYGANELDPLFVRSVGSCCSINPSVSVHGDHTMNRITTLSDDAFKLFLPEREFMALPPWRLPEGAEYGRLEIGSDVWIGANVFINASRCRKIGDGAIIGAGAVLMEDVPPYAVAAGVPARVKKYRFSPEQIEILLKVRWWEWDDETLRGNVALIQNPELFFARFGGV